MGKKCDLCKGVARMYCESDQASLCFDCDGKVHGANFLVAKHTRCLLCSSCQSLTPWKATGLRLGPTFSVCDSCVALKSAGGTSDASTNRISTEMNGFDYESDRIVEDDGDGAESYDDDEDEEEDDEYSDEDDEDDDVDEEEEEAENQVVPWSAAAEEIPMMSSSSSNGGSGDLLVKRIRDGSDDEIGCYASGQESNFPRPLKRPLIDEHAFRSTVVMNSDIRLDGENIERRR
ncbi:unnamed protein product [Cochlearia groenlandica]